MPVYLEVVLFEVGLFDEEELLEGALFQDGGLVDGYCDGLVEDVVLHVELSLPGPHPTDGVGVGGVNVDLYDS